MGVLERHPGDGDMTWALLRQVEVKMQHLILLMTSWVTWIKSYFPKGISVASGLSPWFLVFLGYFQQQEWNGCCIPQPEIPNLASRGRQLVTVGRAALGAAASVSVTRELSVCELLTLGSVRSQQIVQVHVQSRPSRADTEGFQAEHLVWNQMLLLCQPGCSYSPSGLPFLSLNCRSNFSERPDCEKTQGCDHTLANCCSEQWLESPGPAPQGFAAVPPTRRACAALWDWGASVAPQTTTNTHKNTS